LNEVDQESFEQLASLLPLILTGIGTTLLYLFILRVSLPGVLISATLLP
jgi:hypothetical protein